MESRATASFWKCLSSLPPEVRRLAEKQYILWKSDHRHASLQFKKVQAYWSARVNDNHRALGIVQDGVIIWFWIGNHSEYERLIKRK